MALKQKILITDNISEAAFNILSEEFELEIRKGLETLELKNEISQCEAIIIKSSIKLSDDILNSAKKLKVIGKAGANVDNIDLKSATKKGIVIVHTPLSNTTSIAEFAITLLLALAKKLPMANYETKQGLWDKKKFEGIEVEGKTLGILGFGKVGQIVAKKATCLGMNVIAFDPYVSEDKYWQSQIKKANTIEQLYENADFISIHLPKTKETTNLLNKNEFYKMKKGTIIINVSRGGIIVEDDLYESIVEGQIAAAGIDVYEKEPCKNSKLFQLDNVICTPHISSSTFEAQEKADIIIANQIKKVLKNEMSSFAINLPIYNEEAFNLISPFIELCEDLGILFSQLFEGKVKELELTFSGKVAGYKTDFLLNVILAKILQKYSNEIINVVNAKIFADEMGLKIKEVKNLQSQDYINLITLKGKNDNNELSVSGTIIGIKNMPRFISIDKFEIDMVPSKYMAFIKYQDIPGQIGKIGTVFGKLGVNIAAMHVGRKVVSGEALMGLNLDCEVTQEMLEEFKKQSGFTKIKIIKL